MRQAGYLLTGVLVILALGSTGCPPAPPPVNTTPSNASTAPVANPLEVRMYDAIPMVASRELDPSHGFWTVFHGILGLGPELMLNDKKAGKKVKALDYIRMGGEMPGLRFDIRAQGLDVHTAAATDVFFAQGHQDQFVAEMAQWGVPLTLPFKVYGKDYTFADFVNYSKFRASVTRKQELAWAILIVSEFEGSQVAWSNQFNESLTLEDMVRYELDSPMDPDEAVKIGQLPLACGGTHRLFGLSWALHVHLQNGGKLTGIWKKVDDKLSSYKTTIKNIRNEDGSFSTNYLVKKGNVADIGTRMSTTGHTFEWLALACTDAELREPWMEDAASYLTKLVYDVQREPVEGGSLYHAVHGLLMYYARVFGPDKLGPYIPYMRLAPGNKTVVRKTS